MWPITDALENVTCYNLRAPCGCWYELGTLKFNGTLGELVTMDATIAVSPYRMQRCFKHMKCEHIDIVLDIETDLQNKLNENSV